MTTPTPEKAIPAKAVEAAINAHAKIAECWPERAMRAALAAALPHLAAAGTSGGEHGTCPRCQGNGEIVTDWERYQHPHKGDKGDEAVAECPDCNGDGKVTPPKPSAGEPSEVVKRLREWSANLRVQTFAEAADLIEKQVADLASLRALCDRLRMEAQAHALEAATHKSSLHEAYQAVTGSTGEPGNWNGAKPIVKALAALRERVERAEGEAAKNLKHREQNAEIAVRLIDERDAAESTRDAALADVRRLTEERPKVEAFRADDVRDAILEAATAYFGPLSQRDIDVIDVVLTTPALASLAAKIGATTDDRA